MGIFFGSCSHKNLKDDPQAELIVQLIDGAKKYKDTVMNTDRADSLAEEALKFALVSNNDFLISRAYTANLEYRTGQNLNVEQGKEYFSQALNNARNIGNDSLAADAYLAYTHFLIKRNLPKDALNYLNMMPEMKSDKDFFKVKELLLHSEINKIENQPFEQLRNLMDANYKAYDAENYQLKNETDQKLSDFYLNEKKYENALGYNDKMRASIASQTKIDSVQWYYVEADRLVILTKYIDNSAVIDIARKIDDFGKRMNIPKLSFYAQSSLRTYLIDHQDFNSLENWYNKYPSQLQELKVQNKSYYYRVKAYLSENRKVVDSAKYFFDAALQSSQDQNPYSLYTYYLRKGDFEKRNNQLKQAYSDYEQAFEYSLKTNNYYNQIAVGEDIVAYFMKEKNDVKANQYLTKLNLAKSDLIQFLSDDNIRSVELDNILAQKELARKKILERQEMKHNQQYLIITLFIILVLMTLVVVSYYKVPIWWIKSMGYVSFLMFFEFLMMLIDGWLHAFTHGEPWKILLFKVVLLTFLVPIHHWIEKYIVNLLLQDHLRNFVKKHGFNKKREMEV